jgi:hypothetical protein
MLDNTIVITFANNPIHYGYQEQFDKLYRHNFVDHIQYTEADIIVSDFYKENMQMFQYKKYFGYFLWKPYIIVHAMKHNKGKDILYCDSNLRFTNYTMFENSYKQLMDTQGAYFVSHDNFINKDWTKRDTFLVMDADKEAYYNANQVWTPLMGFRYGINSMHLISEYLKYCKIPAAVTEEPNILGQPNLEGFREHRWEQSIMSILVKRYDYLGIPDSQVMQWVTKEYSPELMKMKERVNADPLGKSI